LDFNFWTKSWISHIRTKKKNRKTLLLTGSFMSQLI
jgi:hypothetical protein